MLLLDAPQPLLQSLLSTWRSTLGYPRMPFIIIQARILPSAASPRLVRTSACAEACSSRMLSVFILVW